MSGWDLFFTVLGVALLTAQFFRLVDALAEDDPPCPGVSLRPMEIWRTAERNFRDPWRTFR